VVFQSFASNLVAGDYNGTWDIFVKDLQSGAIQCVSIDAAGAQGNSSSWNAQISTDGRYVVFESDAGNLVAGDSNGARDVFVKDLQSGAIQLASTDAAGVQGNDGSFKAQISADARYVVFESVASNLVANDSNGMMDIFIKELQSGTIQRISTDAAGAQGNSSSTNAQFSADGRYVVFESYASNLVAGDSNGTYDIFVKDLQSGAIQRVSTDAAGVQGNSHSTNAQFSADGRYVVFKSLANNLVSGDSNNAYDIFVKDLQSGAIQRVSSDAIGTQGNDGSSNAQFSADGRYVVFDSDANNLVAGDSNGAPDVFRVANPFLVDKGVDTVQSLLSYTLPAAVENLTLTGTGDVDGTGNGLANRLIGNSGANSLSGDAGNDTLDGGSGIDTMTGGDGSDYYYVRDNGDLVSETNAIAATGGTDTVYSTLSNYTLGTNVENGRILATGTANLTGNTLSNLLYAGAGNNSLTGGDGTDTVSYAYGLSGTTGVTVSLALATAQATVGSGSDTLDSIENLTGSSYNDRLTGNAGANILDGGSGIDTLTGGDGSDYYYVRDSGDLVSETNAVAATGGTDTVYSTLSTYTLGANVENGRILSTGTAHLTGNTLNNLLYAGAGNNSLDGRTGTDTVSYAYGLSGTTGVTVSLALATAQATGGSGTDTLISIENLTGSSYNDLLTGNAGANILDGGSGIDTMTGGDGSDTYYVRDSGDLVSETNAVAATGGTDTVYSTLSATPSAPTSRTAAFSPPAPPTSPATPSTTSSTPAPATTA
jgi:Ca2+-binding RTX toxin-like protein